jgi:hypothetical protein
VFLILALGFSLGFDTAKEPDVPEVNAKVLEFCRANLGKKIGDGECTSLAAAALRQAKAKRSTTRDKEYVWGKLVRTVTAKTNLTGDVLPGDVLQFRDAHFKKKIEGGTIEATYPQHTAIVAAVKDEGKVVEVLHQNVGDSRQTDRERRTVQRATIHFNQLQKGGWVKIYRPVPQ